MAKRISITSSQAASGAAADLVALLQTITEDGRIGNSEIKSLRNWLETNKDCGLPSVPFLTLTIDAIAADGKVTDKEREELAKAVEKVLPPELREFAKQRRRLLALQKKEAAAAQAESTAAEAARTAAVGSLDFVVAGVAYDSRAAIAAMLHAGDPIYLIRDRGNAHSRNAIEVRDQSGRQIGFVPEADAVVLAPYLDAGYRLRTSVKHMWQGRQCLIPIVEGDVYAPENRLPGTYVAGDVPSRRGIRSTSATRGCLPLMIVLVMSLASLALMARHFITA